jgi:hypothetical protein
MPFSLPIYGFVLAAALAVTGGAYWKGRSDGFNGCVVAALQANDAAARAAFEARSRSERDFDASRLRDNDPNRRD